MMPLHRRCSAGFAQTKYDVIVVRLFQFAVTCVPLFEADMKRLSFWHGLSKGAPQAWLVGERSRLVPQTAKPRTRPTPRKCV